MSAIRCPLFFETVRFLCKDCKKHFQYVRLVGFMPLDITNISIFCFFTLYKEKLFRQEILLCAKE